MSASEKLKALGEHERMPYVEVGTEEFVVLWDALPQIVAIVEAAEDELRSEDCTATVAALAALEEALS